MKTYQSIKLLLILILCLPMLCVPTVGRANFFEIINLGGTPI